MKYIVFWQWPFYIVYGFLYITSLVGGASGELTVDSTYNNDHHLELHQAIDSNMTPSTRKDEIETSSINSDNSLEEQLADDQRALKRMILILSLVGGLGAIAIAITIVIFTKVRKRKQWINDKTSRSLLIKDSDLPIQDLGGLDPQSMEVSQPLSSAPPMSTSYSIAPGRPSCHPVLTHLQQIMPMPSAPSAKELSKMCTLSDPDDHRSTGLVNSITLTPEIPPPAYTPFV